MADSALNIRPVRAGDTDFVLGLASRFVSFELPAWRDRDESGAGVRRDLERHLKERPAGSHFFVAELDGKPAGILHLQDAVDFFTGARNCHISDVAVAPGFDGRGLGARLLAYAEDWAKRNGCRFLTLSVFPGNERARALYERHGFGVELLRMAKPVA